ncbi:MULTISPECIES: hypothetical protein [unclassified Guyparkeria]|uniref:hypothetical protein n=1 Tax=unclassified Guyparkeria TaxID=2626246 RepID=UPI0007338B0C|nr:MULTISPECIES: hypothetical protein [unclassified Guyparkeria]KTG17130.1 hypothetical protein AUR63_10315 [Guyparkeria sp. XI15]OAE86665.1 hypothetical protein AWR35_10330 [Guyparkeria sp. WRN-7]
MKKPLACLALAALASGCTTAGTTHPSHSMKDDLSACLAQVDSKKDLLLVEAPVANNPLSNAIVNGLAGKSPAAEQLIAALSNRQGRPVLVFGRNEANNTALLRAALKPLPEATAGREVCLAASDAKADELRTLAASRGFELVPTRSGG